MKKRVISPNSWCIGKVPHWYAGRPNDMRIVYEVEGKTDMSLWFLNVLPINQEFVDGDYRFECAGGLMLHTMDDRFSRRDFWAWEERGQIELCNYEDWVYIKGDLP